VVLQRDGADRRQWQRGVGRFGLRSATHQLVSDPLQLPVEAHLVQVGADVLQPETKYLAPPQAEHEDQDVRGV
jgi:hypothetical protein